MKVDGNRLDEKTTEEDNKTDEEKVMGGKGEENMMDAHDEEDRYVSVASYWPSGESP